MATSLKPFCSKRLTISPIRPRCTPSGLMAMKVRSVLAAMTLRRGTWSPLNQQNNVWWTDEGRFINHLNCCESVMSIYCIQSVIQAFYKNDQTWSWCGLAVVRVWTAVSESGVIFKVRGHVCWGFQLPEQVTWHPVCTSDELAQAKMASSSLAHAHSRFRWARRKGHVLTL